MDALFDAAKAPEGWGAQVWQPSTLLEAECYGDDNRAQGMAVYLVREQIRITENGAFAKVDCLGASDGYCYGSRLQEAGPEGGAGHGLLQEVGRVDLLPGLLRLLGSASAGLVYSKRWIEWIFFQDFCGYQVVRAQVMAYSQKWIEWIFFPDSCGYLEVLAQIMVYSDEWIERIIFQDFCGYLVVKAQVMAYSKKWVE